MRFFYPIALALFLLLPLSLYAQRLEEEPIIERLYGRSGQDRLFSLTENWEGNIAAVGQSNRGTYGGTDIYLLLLDEQLKRKSNFTWAAMATMVPTGFGRIWMDVTSSRVIPRPPVEVENSKTAILAKKMPGCSS
ncbi:MAG: hypothetical protein IPO07_04700 [Haliscomenobacter sp.]|nr:hypothetical protein [Haliscomenobacter sp.]MBK9488162.1 hypothetical protein [Haliscomenobacter sp.]